MLYRRPTNCEENDYDRQHKHEALCDLADDECEWTWYRGGPGPEKVLASRVHCATAQVDKTRSSRSRIVLIVTAEPS